MHVTLRYVGLLVALAACGAARAQEMERDDAALPRGGSNSGLGAVLRLMRSTQQLGDWDEHHGYLMDSLARVYERQGWNSEADAFSFELADAVERVPPWDLPGRFDLFMTMIGDRYLLDDEQEQWLRQRLMRDATGLLQRQAGQVMQYMPEIIATRAAGEAITPEQVARWAESAGPVIADAQATMRKAAEDFARQLDPQQRDILEGDLAAADRRIDGVRAMLPGWRAGRWSEADWGLDGDPIQAHGLPAERSRDSQKPAHDAVDARGEGATTETDGQAAAAEPGRRPGERRARVGGGGHSADDDPWAVHVRAVIAKYRLNEDQQQHAWRVYRSAAGQRDRMTRRSGGADRPSEGSPTSRPAGVEGREAPGGTAASARLQRLFEALKVRLERIPTRAQRAGSAGK